jgi:hypothetical protein
MRFFIVFEGEGDNRVAVCLNMAHVVKVIDHDGGMLSVHLSDGSSHLVADESKREFRALLKGLANPAR